MRLVSRLRRCLVPMRPASGAALIAALGLGQAAHAEELELEGAISAALRTHERVLVAELRIEEAEADVVSARSEFLPSLTLGASATAKPTADDGGRYVTAAGTLTLSQPILAPSAIPRLSSAEHSVTAETWSREEERRAVAFDTARAFLSALLAERLVDASESRLARARANLAAAVARAEADLASSNDVTRAKLDVASALRDVSERKRGRTEARLGLELVTGVPVTGLRQPDAFLAASLEAPSVSSDTDGAVRERRADLKSLDEQILASRELADEPMMRLVPSIDLTAQLRVNPDPLPSQSWHDESVTLSFSWTIFDGGRRYADRDAQSARVAVLEAQRSLAERTLTTEVRVASANLEAARSSYDVAREATTSARANVDETNELYTQGLARAIEVTDANAESFAAEIEAATSQIEIARSYLDLRFALGLDPVEGGPR